MSLLKRTKNIIKAQLSDFEFIKDDPDKHFQQTMSDMEQFIKQIKLSLAVTATELKLLEKEIDKKEEEQALWLARAEKAVGAGRDDLARQALFQKKSAQENIYKERLVINNLKNELENLNSALLDAQLDFSKMQNNYTLFKHRQITAYQQLQSQSDLSTTNLDSEFLKYHQQNELLNNEQEISILKDKLIKKHKEK